MNIKPSKKSGFAEGRVAARGSSSSDSTKKKKLLDRQKAAENDLTKIMEEIGEDVDTEETAHNFRRDFKRIRRNVIEGGNDFNADSASRMLLKSIFAMNLSLMPKAQYAYSKTGKEQHMYALIALEKQSLEIASELKMLGNVEHQAAFINERIINPLFQAFIQTMLREVMDLKNTVDTEVESSKSAKRIKYRVDDMLKSCGTFLDTAKEKIAGDIHSYLGGDLSFLEVNKGENAPKKRGRKRREADL